MSVEKSAQGIPVSKTIPVKGSKKMIADHMLHSHPNYAEMSGMTEINATKIVELYQELRPRLEESEGVRLTYTALFIKAVAQALKDNLLLNSTLEENTIKILDEINIAVAVTLPDGLLIAPVIRHADTKSLVQVALELGDLATRARQGKLALKEVSGGTFTVTNIGTFGADCATPIINEPQTGIIAFGRVVQKPAVVEGEIVPQWMMWVSMTVDHRVVNGAETAQFAQALADLFLEPSKLDLDLAR